LIGRERTRRHTTGNASYSFPPVFFVGPRFDLSLALWQDRCDGRGRHPQGEDGPKGLRYDRQRTACLLRQFRMARLALRKARPPARAQSHVRERDPSAPPSRTLALTLLRGPTLAPVPAEIDAGLRVAEVVVRMGA